MLGTPASHGMPTSRAASFLDRWYRPWCDVHVSWLDGLPTPLAQCGELTLRRAYAAWCEHFGLVRDPPQIDDGLWWTLYAWPSDRLDDVVRSVGLALTFAADPRSRMHTSAWARQWGIDAVRWALSRSALIGSPFAQDCLANDGAGGPEGAGRAALRRASSLCAPSWTRRLAMRLRRDTPVGSPLVQERDARVGPASESTRPLLLWRSAVRRVESNANRDGGGPDVRPEPGAP